MNKAPDRPDRIIESVYFDGEIGVVTADDLIAMPETNWGHLRDRLTDQHQGKRPGLSAQCMMCSHPVYISGRKWKDKYLPLFQHFQGAPLSCKWHHGPTKHPDDIRAAQYQGQQESFAHRFLCNQLDQLARLDPRYICSKINKYLPPTTLTKSSVGRYPDIYVEWKDFVPFTIEIQLSNTFQTEISDRCTFYEQESKGLIWILYSVNPTTQVLPQSLRDVIRKHRGNAFIVDSASIAESKKQKTIVLQCFLENDDGSFEEAKLVRLDKLNFPKSGLPYLEDRIVEPLCKRTELARRPWFNALRSLNQVIKKDSHESAVVLKAFASLNSKQYANQKFLENPETRYHTLRLVAVVFSIVESKKFGKPKNYATLHPNIASMVNTLLNIETGMERYATMLEYLLEKTKYAELLGKTTVRTHISRAKHKHEANQCRYGDPEWEIMAHLVPEVFDPIIRNKLEYLDALPEWAPAR